MQLFNGSYFSVGSYFIAKGTTYVNYVSPTSKWSIKIRIFHWSTNETLIIGI